MSRHLHVITGPPGSGKTPLLHELGRSGFETVEEPARVVIAEQRAIAEVPIYDRDPGRFLDLMVSRAIADYEANTKADAPVFFDRAIPDIIGYARLFGLDDSEAMSAARDRRYNEIVFALPSRAEIYTTDDDRRMTFEQSVSFGRVVHEIYESLGYTVVELPQDTILERRRFVLEVLGL